MSVYHLLARPAAAHVSVAAAGYELGVGRTVPTVAMVLGLISVVVGGLALARSRRTSTGTGRNGAVVAVVLGLISAVVGGVHGANAAGGPGTGNGVLGVIVALVLGPIGMVLGGLTLARSRRTSHGAGSVPVP
ncbi:DUF6223 family protein [Actinopolymorpha singaporensis]